MDEGRGLGVHLILAELITRGELHPPRLRGFARTPPRPERWPRGCSGQGLDRQTHGELGRPPRIQIRKRRERCPATAQSTEHLLVRRHEVGPRSEYFHPFVI